MKGLSDLTIRARLDAQTAAETFNDGVTRGIQQAVEELKALQDEPASLGSRLRRAIDQWGSVRQFTIQSGASSGAVYRYLGDEASPNADFLATASRILGVSIDWLLTGQEGAPCSVCHLRERRIREAVRILSVDRRDDDPRFIGVAGQP